MFNKINNKKNSSKKNNRRYTNKKKSKIRGITCKNFETKLIGKNSNKLDLLGEGSYGIAFLGCLDQLCDESIGVKFLVLKKKYKLNNSHPGFVEVIFGMRLSDLYYKNITPHINLVYRGFTCNINNLKNSKTIYESEWYKNKEKDSTFTEECYKDVMIIFNEKADMDFKQYVTNRFNNQNKLTDHEHLICLFQFCYTISCAQYHIPGFRHNDIKPNNLLVSLNKNISHNTYDIYKIFGRTFYVPVKEFTIKLHDFDFCNSDQYPNQKIHNYENTIFSNIGTTPFNNPVYDLHEYINFYYRDLQDTFMNQETFSLFKYLIPENTFGESNEYTNRYKLTNFRKTLNIDAKTEKQKNEKYNYIPKDMKTPSELILSFKKFKYFNKEPIGSFTIRNVYDSKIPSTKSKNLLRRTDMFNTFLVN